MGLINPLNSELIPICHFPALLRGHPTLHVSRVRAKLGGPKNTAEQPVPKPSAFEVQWAIEKLKSHELAVIDQIPAETFKAVTRRIRF